MTSQHQPGSASEAGQDAPQWLPSYWSFRRFLPVALLLMMGITFFITLFYLVRVYEKERQRDLFVRVSEARINEFTRRKESDLEALMSIGHFFAASSKVEAREFGVFVKGPLQWHPEIESLSWIPRLPAANRLALESLIGQPLLELGPGGTRVPANDRETYYPMLYHETLVPHASYQVWDVASDPILNVTLSHILKAANGQMLSTPRVMVPSSATNATPKPAIYVFLPIYFKSPDPTVSMYHPTNLMGFVSALLRPNVMLRESQGARITEKLDVCLFDHSPMQGPVLLDYQSADPHFVPAHPPTLPDTSTPSKEFAETATVSLAGRTWTILCRPSVGYSRRMDWEGWSVLVGGLLMTVLLSSYLYTLLGQNAYIENVVTRRTRELAAMNVRLQNEIGERERGDRALRDSEALYHSLVDTVPLSIIRKNIHGEILFGNKRYCETIGQPLEAVLGKTDFDLFPKKLSEKYVADDRKVIESRSIFEDVEEHRRPDGTLTYVQVLKAPVFDALGRVVGTQVIFWDVTEKKRSEENLKQTLADLARSNRDLEQFAYVASHDLQEPLRMIASYTQLLGKRYHHQLDGEAGEFIQFAVEGAVRMQLLINDLLAYSRLGTRGAPFTAVRMDEALDAALNNLQISIDESCALITREPLPTLHGDAIQMVQLLQNLLANSIKFRGDESPKIQVGVTRDPQEWIFAVRDNGIGIDPKHSERVFVIFQRLHNREKYSGTGIGLAICKKIVERHEGRIWVESIPGKGATFYFTLPASPEA